MKTTTQCLQSQNAANVWTRENRSNLLSGIVPKALLPSGWCAFVAALMILLRLANPVPAQLEDIELGALPGDTSEYCSTDGAKAIPDNGTLTSALAISDGGTIVDLNVKVKIAHTFAMDMDVFLIAPDGTRVELFTDVGGMADNFDNTILDDEATQLITTGKAPFAGSYRPEGSLADMIGKDFAGTWILEVTDDYDGDTGTLESWCLIATIESKEPLPAPVIQSQASAPGGLRDVVSWDDLGKIREFGLTTVEPIPGQGTLTQTLMVDDLGMIEDLDVKVNFNHEWDSDLDVYLIAPDATRIELFTDVGGSQDHFVDTILDDQSSTPITAGAAPFTGRYRPEGVLGGLVGKDIHGQWKLEATDDSSNGSGTLNSWSLIANLADVLYYVECATDAGFATVVANSGWTVSQSHTFTALDPQKTHWYRAKARPAETWSQTSQTDFAADVLTTTEATTAGDVTLLSGGSGPGPELHVIQNPSFELSSGWWAASNNIVLLFMGMGVYPNDIWGTDGRRVAGVIFSEDFPSDTGDYADWRQPVNWTGVGTLVLDNCSTLGDRLVSKVLIGDTEVWSDPHVGGVIDEHKDVTIDVSRFTGSKDLKLRVKVQNGGRFWAGVFWDNLRTYGPSGPTSGSVISTPISIGANDTWDVLAFDATTPPGTQLTVDVLPETGSNPISGYAHIATGTDLSPLATRTIRLRANLSTSDRTAKPVLHRWSVSYGDARRESVWSNVESSAP